MQGKQSAGVLALAIIATLGLAVAPGLGAKAKKVASEVEVDGWYFDADDLDMVLAGDVHANKPKCEKGRAVTAYTSDNAFDDPPPEGTGDESFEVTTDKNGDWEVNLETDGGNDPNWVTASLTRKKVTKASGKKLKCSADIAPVVPSD